LISNEVIDVVDTKKVLLFLLCMTSNCRLFPSLISFSFHDFFIKWNSINETMGDGGEERTFGDDHLDLERKMKRERERDETIRRRLVDEK
jgi:hypothetical protein